MDFELCLDTAVNLARKAGEIARVGSEKMKSEKFANVQTKATPIDLVTEYDKKVEQFLFAGLKDKFPDHKFIGEESSSEKNIVELTEEPTWVIDPIDGTMNFVHRFPYSAVCIGLMVDRQVEVGVVYHIAYDQMYTAVKGKGAFLNNQKIEVSHQEDLSQSLIGSEFGSRRDTDIVKTILSNMEKVHGASHGLRLLGSAALNMCHVARGALDAYYEFGIHIWDIAASSLIVQEAGGVVIDPSGDPIDLLARRVLCASSSSVATKLSKLLDPLTFERDGK